MYDVNAGLLSSTKAQGALSPNSGNDLLLGMYIQYFLDLRYVIFHGALTDEYGLPYLAVR